jgi:dihydrofolate reductase
MERFKSLTMGHAVIMGRRTHEAIGGPLQGRRNLVLSRRPGYSARGCEVFTSLEAAIVAAGPGSEVFIIGGAEIYREALRIADRLYLTLVDDAPAGADAFFPDSSAFAKEISRQESETGGRGVTYLVLDRG